MSHHHLEQHKDNNKEGEKQEEEVIPKNQTTTSRNEGDTNKEQQKPVRKAAPEALWECNICLETAVEPIITQCGHLYCWPCIHKWLIMHPIHQNCPVCNKDIVEELLIPLYGNESDSQPLKGNAASGDLEKSKIPSRPQGVNLPPNPYSNGDFAQANLNNVGGLARVAEAYPQQNNRRFGSTVPGVAFQFGFRLLVTGESPGYAQQQALLSWMLLLLGSFVVFCLLVF